MKIIQTALDGLLVLEPKIFSDNRGYFFEVFHEKRYADLGIPSFVQDNHSYSRKNVLRGLHYQLAPKAQGKLVGVTKGKVWDVAVDLRIGSPTFGKWHAVILDDESHRQMYIPPGFAHGYCVLSDTADFYYKCTELYEPQAEGGIAWNDKQLAITWPITEPVLSSKDLIHPQLHEIPHEKLFA